MDRLDCGLEIKFSGAAADGTFSGYGAVFGNVDAAGDVIERGAFKRTLREWEEKGKLPPMLLQHGGGMFGGNADDMLPVGRWLSMEENSKGLKVEGQLFALGTERGQYLYEGLKAGALDGLSIGYRAKKFALRTKPDEPRRKLEDLDLVELSIVTFPANDKARVGAVKTAEDLKTIRDFEEALVRGTLPPLPAKEAKRLLADGFNAIRSERDAGAMSDELAEIIRRNTQSLVLKG